MTQATLLQPSDANVDALRERVDRCCKLAQDVTSQEEARRAFADLKRWADDRDPAVAQLLDVLWQELLSARRSEVFWKELSNVEKELSLRMAENSMQLRQNYQRLLAEQ